MKCLDPQLVFQLDKRTVYRNWSFAKNSVMLRGLRPAQVFNCRKCLVCRKRLSIELAARCVLHASLYQENSFLTLTYDEKKDGYHNVFEYRDIQLLKKRLRQHLFRHYGKRVELFNVHEYGKNGKKHWHLILFGHDFSQEMSDGKRVPRQVYTVKNGNTLYTSPVLEGFWSHGFSTIGNVSEASAMYQAQYMEKDFRNGNVTNEKKSHSKHSGLGRPYFMKNYRQLLMLGYVPVFGRKFPLFRYFEKLARRHWAHFYEPSMFFDNSERKAPFRPFKPGQENKEIADLYVHYKSMKDDKVLEYERQFEEVIDQYLIDKKDTEFVRSGANAEYDLHQRIFSERF